MSHDQRPPVEDFADKAAGVLVSVAFVFGWLWLAGVLGYQVWHWLQEGVWLPLPFRLALEFIGLNVPEPVEIDGWVGLSRVLEWAINLPMSVMVGLAVFAVAVLVNGMVRR
ncbi:MULTISPECIES: hypothetical protein [unclassified Thioalkalivibrio]|uniref:hypothetical protein n=1 Tax=unclassified Thioalkalivibrio TaxID=2621013 RepID=UPI000364AB39|nr:MULTISPECIES: hypothetical protein [unclassified Thioalkalivibrio]